MVSKSGTAKKLGSLGGEFFVLKPQFNGTVSKMEKRLKVGASVYQTDVPYIIVSNNVTECCL